MILMPQICY